MKPNTENMLASNSLLAVNSVIMKMSNPMWEDKWTLCEQCHGAVAQRNVNGVPMCEECSGDYTICEICHIRHGQPNKDDVIICKQCADRARREKYDERGEI